MARVVICGSVEGLDPIGRGEAGLEQQGTHNVVGGTDNAFGLAILGGGVGTRHAKVNAMSEEESASAGVVKLATVVTLDVLDRGTELCSHIREKMRDSGKSVGLKTKRKRPKRMRAIIKNDQIKLITRHTDDR